MQVNLLIICNDQNKSYYKNLAENLTKSVLYLSRDKGLLDYLQDGELEEIDLCIIQVELGWENRQPDSFYGFEVAKKLRKAGLKSIIYFLHFFPEDRFDPVRTRYALLRVNTFHKLIKTSANTEDIASRLQPQKMSLLQWEDISETLLGIRSLVQELIHDLKNRVIRSGKNDEVKIEEIIDQSFQELFNLLSDQTTALSQIRKNLLLEISDPKKGLSPQEIVENFASQITSLAPIEDKDDDEVNFPRPPWKVLLVEDDSNVTETLNDGFERNNIQYESVYSGSEALKILANDKKQSIAVLLCDLRLKEDDSRYWQPLQGYDIIEQVRKENTYLGAFFVLTSAKKRLINLTKNFKTNITADHKSYVLSSDGALNLFIQKLRQSGDEFFFRVRSRPRLSAWNKKTQRFYQPLCQFYRAHIYSLDYDLAEQTINQEAQEYVEKMEAGLLKKGEAEFNITILLKEQKKKPSKEITEQQINQAFDKFRDHILVGRRVALALFLKGYSEDEVFDFMQPGSDANNRKASKDLLFKTTLALSFAKDFPDPEDIRQGRYLKSNLLLEEIQWLIEFYQADFDLDQIRVNVVDANTVWGILDDIRYSIKKKINGQALSLSSKQQNFLDKDIKEITTLKEIKGLLQIVNELAGHFGLSKDFNLLIKEELETIENPEVKKILMDRVL
ncbi:MAG: hypothetical protein DHS20C18_00230 [Saprospiraceae bacterium]|nr:MAG: hypothetical protein DHS20C18_00230 [Saprospiraceae bacterium]